MKGREEDNLPGLLRTIARNYKIDVRNSNYTLGMPTLP
jgi:hypothetical protein